MYSILGMIIFGEVKRVSYIDDYINFESFFNAFLTLFIVATGDSWNLIMASYGVEKSPSYQCIVSPSYEDYRDIGGMKTVGCGD